MMKVSEINTSTQEGRLLMAAVAIITTESRTDNNPDNVLESITALAAEMFDETPPAGDRRDNENEKY